MNNKELVKRWVAEEFNSGGLKGSNMYINGSNGVIYSYGDHFPIARFIGDGRVIFNKDRYSVTTGKHKSIVLDAIRGLDIIYLSTHEMQSAIRQLEAHDGCIFIDRPFDEKKASLEWFEQVMLSLLKGKNVNTIRAKNVVKRAMQEIRPLVVLSSM